MQEEITEILIETYHYVIIDRYEHGLSVIAHRDTTVEKRGTCLHIEDSPSTEPCATSENHPHHLIPCTHDNIGSVSYKGCGNVMCRVPLSKTNCLISLMGSFNFMFCIEQVFKDLKVDLVGCGSLYLCNAVVDSLTVNITGVVKMKGFTVQNDATFRTLGGGCVTCTAKESAHVSQSVVGSGKVKVHRA